ncbi:uncharacterized protein LOC104883279 [Beta vulgaris subsp. vulgaris]|uniref:uncharacterized protein LOC104883279 n=1 Tax=Beta vulgaris subsp. vulgaris TaxID=3555 RepID=UPI00203740D6|nr:uncharacterized protein LOC104883279 [Beta vulgaris subsp. vulgaris]XP_010666071.2 uncharacterized protein LOC104883279 [Beta vulgaris subsp. vulgaris]
MEGKQLNFNRPLLSVRRGSSVTGPPENERDNTRRNLPPLPYYKSELKSGPVRNPGVVPFKWEHKPGRPKDKNTVQKDSLERLPPTPKLPPGRIINHVQKQTDEILRDTSTYSSRYQAEINDPHSLQNSSHDQVFSEVEGSEKDKEEKGISSSEDDNITYVDARDTLSRNDSFFNCSVSGVSGVDCPASSGAFSDPQTRDFMMDRFLPAAKAVASDTPPFASRRNPVAREQAKPMTKVIKWKKQPPQYYSIPDTLPNSINGEWKDEEEDEEDESDESEDLSVKLCGLMPRFCLLNPIPGMRDHVEEISRVRSVRTRSSNATACRDNKHKDMIKDNSRGELKRTSHQYAPAPMNESLMDIHLSCNGMARHKSASPQSFLDREKKLLGLPGEPRDFHGSKLNLPHIGHTRFELATPRDTEEITSSVVNPADEKTVYVDSEKMVESRHSNSSTSESRGRNPSVDYSVQDIKSLCCNEEKATLQSESPETEFSTLPTSEKSCLDVREDMKNLRKDDRDVNSDVETYQPPKPAAKSMKHSEKYSSPLTMTPLLPKSPSESWLSRTLSSRNSSSKSYLANHAFRLSPMDPKRERVLKASNVENLLFQSAGELAPIFEH